MNDLRKYWQHLIVLVSFPLSFFYYQIYANPDSLTIDRGALASRLSANYNLERESQSFTHYSQSKEKIQKLLDYYSEKTLERNGLKAGYCLSIFSSRYSNSEDLDNCYNKTNYLYSKFINKEFI